MKKNLSIILVIMLMLCFSGCKSKEDVSSDISNLSSKTESISSNMIVSSSEDASIVESEDATVSEDSPSSSNVSSTFTVTSHNSSISTVSKTPVTNSDPSSSSSSVSETPVKSSTPSSSTIQSSQNNNSNSSSQSSVVSSQTSIPAPTVTPLQKMLGTWRFVIPENTLSMDCIANMGYRIVYDLTIAEDNEVYLSEKHFLCSETETVGTVEYFDGKRYTLMYDSLAVIQGSFSGEISISSENKNVAIIKLGGREIATGRYAIDEIHYLTLIDDTHLKWNKAEVYTEILSEQYFPWNAETVFIKK